MVVPAVSFTCVHLFRKGRQVPVPAEELRKIFLALPLILNLFRLADRGNPAHSFLAFNILGLRKNWHIYVVKFKYLARPLSGSHLIILPSCPGSCQTHDCEGNSYISSPRPYKLPGPCLLPVPYRHLQPFYLAGSGDRAQTVKKRDPLLFSKCTLVVY